MATQIAQQRLERARARAKLQKSQAASPVSSSAIGSFYAARQTEGMSPGRAARAEAERVARERAASGGRAHQFEPRRAAKGAGHLNSFMECAEWNWHTLSQRHAAEYANMQAWHVDAVDHFAAGSGAVFQQRPEDAAGDGDGGGAGMLGKDDLGFGHIRRTHTSQGDDVDDHFGRQDMQVEGGQDGAIRAVDGTSLAFRSTKSLDAAATVASVDHLSASMGTDAADAVEGEAVRAELKQAETAAQISTAKYDQYGKGRGATGAQGRSPPKRSGETAAGVNAGSGAWARWGD